MRPQRKAANDIIERYENQLTEFLETNKEEILAYFSGADRRAGFQQDGPNKDQVVAQVESLYGQAKTIESDRQKKAAAWLNEVEQMWSGFETEITQLANEYQLRNGTISLERPFSPTQSKLKLINKWVPWFDLTIGCLLMIGLFSRFASLLGAGFLASVIASQPPWVLDAVPTYYQSVEFFGLLVIFATAAGRCAGLDYFIYQIWNRYRGADYLEDEDELDS